MVVCQFDVLFRRLSLSTTDAPFGLESHAAPDPATKRHHLVLWCPSRLAARGSHQGLDHWIDVQPAKITARVGVTFRSLNPRHCRRLHNGLSLAVVA